MEKISNYVKNSEWNIVFIHGWGGNSLSLLPIAKQFQNQYTYHLLSLKGFDGKEMEKEYDISNYLDDIKLFLNTLSNKKVLIVGHSFGGKLAILLKKEFPSYKVLAIAPSIVKNPFSLRTFLKIHLYKIFKKLNLKIPSYLQGSKDYRSLTGNLKKTFLNVHHYYLSNSEIHKLKDLLIIGFINDKEVNIKSLDRAFKNNKDHYYYRLEGNHFGFHNYLIEIRTLIICYLRGELS